MTKNLRNLVIIGAGDLGREVLVWSRQAIQAGAPWCVKGFLDGRARVLDGYSCDTRILGAPEDYQPQDNDVFLCAVGDPAEKRKYTSMMAAKGAVFATLIHPSALVGPSVVIRTGAIISPFTQLSCDITIGEHAMFGTMSSAGHNTVIGPYSQVSGGCQLNGHARLGEGVFLGSSVTILPKARVEDWAYVGAGSVVLRRVKARTKVFGNPATQIGMVDD
jgi:sugar O-acyltransferase (sialic acid O-acetyltransferase NeuD family)